jgi:hypothetical protein
LRRRTHNARWSTLEECLEPFLLINRLRAVTQAVVCRVALACLNLQPCLDHVAWCGKIRSRHTGNGTRRQHLQNAQLLLGALAEEVLLQVAVGREVDGREGNFALRQKGTAKQAKTPETSRLTITQETGTGALVQANETQVLDNPHGRTPGSAIHVLCDLALNLESNLDNLKRVGEDLRRVNQIPTAWVR